MEYSPDSFIIDLHVKRILLWRPFMLKSVE